MMQAYLHGKKGRCPYFLVNPSVCRRSTVRKNSIAGISPGCPHKHWNPRPLSIAPNLSLTIASSGRADAPDPWRWKYHRKFDSQENCVCDSIFVSRHLIQIL